MIAAPTVANIVRNAAYTIRTGKIHEIAVLRTERALRTGPLVKTEFDGLSILDRVVISEVKKRITEDDPKRLLEDLKRSDKEFEKRLKYIRRYSDVRPLLVVFHKHTISPESVQEMREGKELIAIPAQIDKLPSRIPDDVLYLLVNALIIEFISLPRLACKELPMAMSCNSPPYDVLIEDLKDAVNRKEAREFAKRLVEAAMDPDRLQRLNECQALYALASALRIYGRRREYHEVIEAYKDSIRYVMSLPFYEGLARLSVYITNSALMLIDFLERGEGKVTLPIAPNQHQRMIQVNCFKRLPERLVVLTDISEHEVVKDALDRISKDIKEVYFIDQNLMRYFQYTLYTKGIKDVVVKQIKFGAIPEGELDGFDVLGTDLFLSYKRSRRMLRDIVDKNRIERVFVFHRGIVPPSVEKRRKKGRHALEVM